MKLSDEIKRNDDELSKDKQDDIFFTLLSGKTVSEEIETSRGMFTVKFPKEADMLYIDRRVSAMRAGIPAAWFDDNANFRMQKIAFLDVVIESGEDWFNRLKKKNTFTWGDMPDADFIDEVYVKAWTFRNKVQASFRSHEGDAAGGASDGADVSAAVGDGVFSGVAASVERT